MASRAAAGPPVIVGLPAEIDVTNAEQACDQLDAAFASGAAVVVADLTATRFCDSASVHRMLLVHRRAAASGTQLRLAVSAGGEVARVLDLLGVDQLLPVYPSTDDAVAAEPRLLGRARAAWRRTSRKVRQKSGSPPDLTGLNRT